MKDEGVKATIPSIFFSFSFVYSNYNISRISKRGILGKFYPLITFVPEKQLFFVEMCCRMQFKFLVPTLLLFSNQPLEAQLSLESFVKYFLNSVSILWFYDFMICLIRRNTLILQSCTICFQE